MFPEEWALGGGMLFVWEVVDAVGERGLFLDGPVVATDVDDDTAPGGEADCGLGIFISPTDEEASPGVDDEYIGC